MKIKVPTPLLSAIPVSGGSFYTFPSAAEDLSLSFDKTNSSRMFRFSKFALLNIPNIGQQVKTNQLKLWDHPSTVDSGEFTNNNNTNLLFMDAFQNYCMNLETSIISDDNYDASLPQTVSERVFFKFLKEFGAIRFSNSDSYGGDKHFYQEESINNYSENEYYNRVVQYIGEISYAGNHLLKNNTSLEVTVDVPSDVGNTPTVLFEVDTDKNYDINKYFTNSNDLDHSLDEFINGRSANTIHPDGLDCHAIFDCDNIIFSSSNQDSDKKIFIKESTASDYSDLEDLTFEKLITDPEWVENKTWYGETNNSVSDTYYLEQNSFTDPTNDYIVTVVTDPTTMKRSLVRIIRPRLDGVCINWDVENYKNSLIVSTDENSNNIDTIQRLGTLSSSSDFEFNAVLIYYDIYEADFDSENNELKENILATNLFGILFLDNFETNSSGENGSEGSINRFFKQRANDTTDKSGNEYGFKLNFSLNINTSEINVTRVPVISESNTIAMGLFHDALEQMVQTSQNIENLNLGVLAQEQKINEINNFSLSSEKKNIQDTLIEYNKRLENLETVLKTYSADMDGNSYPTILKQLSQMQTNIDSILAGKINTDFLIDTGNIVGGNGVQVVKNDNNSIKLDLLPEKFNYDFDNSIISINDFKISGDFDYYHIFKLKEGNNYFKIDYKDNINCMQKGHYNVYLDDSDFQWYNGKTLRFILDCNLYLNNTEFDFYTFKNKTSGLYNQNSIFSLRNFCKEHEISVLKCPVFEIHYWNKNFIIDYL